MLERPLWVDSRRFAYGLRFAVSRLSNRHRVRSRIGADSFSDAMSAANHDWRHVLTTTAA